MECAECGKPVDTNTGYCCICDTYIQSRYLKTTDDVFCSPLCLCRALGAIKIRIDEDGKERLNLL